MSSDSKKPTHTAYVIREAKTEGGKGYWMEVGSGWAHEDGKGFSITLDAVPVGGRLVLRERQERTEAEQVD